MVLFRTRTCRAAIPSICTLFFVCAAWALSTWSSSLARAAEATPTKSAAGFYHPGILVNRAQLELIRDKVAAGAEPWKSSFQAAKASEFGSLAYVHHARQTVDCGPYSKPDLGCKDEQRDSDAAYTHALLWFVSGDKAHAEKAIESMN